MSKVQELERYVTDDIERNGVRLLELEKKLVGAYRDAVRISCTIAQLDILTLSLCRPLATSWKKRVSSKRTRRRKLALSLCMYPALPVYSNLN